MNKRKGIPLLILLVTLSVASVSAQRLPLAAGVEKVCSIDFNNDSKRPAKVEDSALPCLEQAAKVLKARARIGVERISASPTSRLTGQSTPSFT